MRIKFFNNKRTSGIGSLLRIIAALAVLVFALIPVKNPYSSGAKDVIVSDARIGTVKEEQTMQEMTVAAASDNVMVQTALAKAFIRNGNPEVNDLMEKYYMALVEGDEQMLGQYTDSTDDIDVVYKGIYARNIEDISDINCYVMNGMLSGTYITVVTSNIKYKGYSTVLPNLNYHYICTDASGNLYVSNKEPGEDVLTYNELMYKSSQINSVVSKFAEEYDAALATDTELAAFIAGFTQ